MVDTEHLGAILIIGALVLGGWAGLAKLLNDYVEWHDGQG